VPRIFVHFSLIFFILTALSGVIMRVFPFYPFDGIPYTNILHGHSHLAILGWAFLGVFTVFLSVGWPSIRQKKQAAAIVCTLFITSLIMFAAFLYEGYALYSIIMSTAHIFVEYWAAVFMYRQLKNLGSKSGQLFMKGALAALIISSIGPFALGYISASGLRESQLFDMAIYFYLHFQYNGWLYLALLGLFAIVMDMKQIPIRVSFLKLGFWIYFISLFPGYFLNVLWADLGEEAHVLSIIGSIGQWIGTICIIFAFKKVWKSLRIEYSKFTVSFLWITFFLLFLKSSMELGLISPKLAELVYETRSVIIGYLHFTLLGFVSFFILVQYQMQRIIELKNGFMLFFAGFFINEILLFSQGLLEWMNMDGVPFLTHGLLLASVLLLLGILMIWLSYFRWEQNRQHKENHSLSNFLNNHV